MAYRDIEMWRQILEAEDQEKKAYDEACEKCEAEGRKLDEKEFWDCDQEEIDPNTMGLNDVAVSGSPELADVEDVDEDIDFSQYGIEGECDEINEADMREPLTAVTAALGRPASTANLDAQNSVQLAEAIRELTKCLKRQKLNEAEGDEPEPEEDEEGDETPEYQAAEKAEAESKEALEAAKRFYSQWLSDPDFRRRAALKTPEGAVQKVPAGYWKKGKDGRNEITTADDPDPAKRQVRGYVVAGTDPNSELAQRFKGYFDLMTDVDKAAFDTWARQQQRFATKHYAPKKPENANKRGDLHGKGGDDDDGVNPLAQHGLDQTFNVDNADDGIFDDFDTGEEFYSEFNPDYQTISHEGVARHILDVADAEAKKMGISREEFFDIFKRLGELAKVRKTVLDKGKKNRQLTDYQVEYIFRMLDPEQLDEFKAELLRDAGDNQKERAFIEYLFRFGKERKVTLTDVLKKFGIAGDQSGKTGDGTQLQDRHIGMLVQALAEYFEVDEDDIPDLKRTCYSQAPTKADKERGIEPRSYSRHLICKITQDLIDQFRGPNMPRVQVPQSPAKGPKIRGKEWEDVKRKLAGFLMMIRLKLKKEELREVALEIDRVFRDKYGDMDAAGNHLGGGTAHVRKFVTYLKGPQQDEFLRLLEKVRTAYDNMTDDEKLRLVQLNRMRLGDNEDTARRKAEQAKAKADKKNAGEWDDVVKRAAKAFLAGQSGNLTRDGIDVANPYEGVVNNGPNAHAPGEFDGLHEAMMKEALEAAKR